MTRNRPRQLRGFTLIEALAALVLIGVVLPVAMRGITVSLAAAAQARRTGEAAELARNKLADLSLTGDVSAYASAGDFGPDWADYRWESIAYEKDWGVHELAVVVFWKSRGQDQSLKLTTLTYPNATLAGAASTEAATP